MDYLYQLYLPVVNIWHNIMISFTAMFKLGDMQIINNILDSLLLCCISQIDLEYNSLKEKTEINPRLSKTYILVLRLTPISLVALLQPLTRNQKI